MVCLEGDKQPLAKANGQSLSKRFRILSLTNLRSQVHFQFQLIEAGAELLSGFVSQFQDVVCVLAKIKYLLVIEALSILEARRDVKIELSSPRGRPVKSCYIKIATT